MTGVSANATVGIAMGAAGSDVALMADNLDHLPFAVELSSCRAVEKNSRHYPSESLLQPQRRRSADSGDHLRARNRASGRASRGLDTGRGVQRPTIARLQGLLG